MKEYKGYQMEIINGSAYIYKDSILLGCCHTDINKENSLEKAKTRIDSGKINSLKK